MWSGEIKTIIQYVIIYGIMEYKYQKNGKMNNIKILKEMKIILI